MMLTKRTSSAKFGTQISIFLSTFSIKKSGTMDNHHAGQKKVKHQLGLFLCVIGYVNSRNGVDYCCIDLFPDASGIDETVCLD